MTEKEVRFWVMDRTEKIRSVISEYGIDNFCMSFSGGRDSCVLSALLDMALPGNSIPRVYVDTGIEYNEIRKFVKQTSETDSRIQIIKPKVPIVPMLRAEGYPFKSKEHSLYLDIFQRLGETSTVTRYLKPAEGRKTFGCPKVLRYQFSEDFKLRVSDKCCKRMKEDPLDEWQKSHGKAYKIIGIMREEGGRRNRAQCMAFTKGKFKAFQPLAPMSKEWEMAFIDLYKIPLCPIYAPPYNFERTGCKGCPFNLHLQRDLETMSLYFPSEARQCEAIWEPVYSEYRKIGYRLSKERFLNEINAIKEDMLAGNSPFDADKIFNKEMEAFPQKRGF